VGQPQGFLGRNLFSGGFLGLDNIGVFDRSKPLGDGNFLEQADGTAWMASYCLTMLAMAWNWRRTIRSTRTSPPSSSSISSPSPMRSTPSAVPASGTRRTASITTRSSRRGSAWSASSSMSSTKDEFLSPYGVRSISRAYRDHPFGEHARRRPNASSYEPGESQTALSSAEIRTGAAPSGSP
jgi:hypothetical protein